MPRRVGFEYNAYPGIPAGIETVSLSDAITYNAVKGFIPNLDGTLAVEMDDGSTGTMIVKGGAQYSAAVAKFKSTGSVTVTGVSIFY